MKICYVANSRFPSERAHMTQIVQMCNAFASCGHEVVLYVTNRKTDVTESPEIFFGVPLHFRVERVPVLDIAGHSPHIPRILRPPLFMFQRIMFAWNASRHMRAQMFDLVYGRDEWVLWLFTFFVRTRIVWESHEARYSFAGKMLLKRHTPLVVIYEGIRDFYVAKGIQKNIILVAHDAVDDRFFSPHVSMDVAREFLHIVAQNPVIMYIGGLEGWKGAETLCRAGEEQSMFEVYIVGGKEKEISLLRAKYPKVHFLGQYPYRELPTVQQSADILVIPNTAKDVVSEKYTSPLKLFAYMTSKKPIVASNVSSITNVLTQEEVSFFTPDDPRSLQEVIVEVLKNPELGERKAVRAYEKSVLYTWHNRAKVICD
ncbi:MAG: glycosyltransferase, partial [Candidatus Kaiserbacteria bacterium]|nr:glycosyltransferase [Candidatus Kaiserbacteria bacterium]